MSEPSKAKPLFLVKPDTMSRADIRRAERLCGICIVECKTPDEARFLDPPLDAQIDVQARAALALTRIVVQHQETTFTRSTLLKWFVSHLTDQAPGAVTPVKRKP